MGRRSLVNKDPELTRFLGTEPLTIETLASGLAIDPTPAEAVYVRNNLTEPELPDSWSVEVAGTKMPRLLSIGELFGNHPRVELTTVLQCAGNGRRRLPTPAAGVQWDLGGMACVDWSGVRLADVVAAAGGVSTEAPYLTVLGSDAAPDDPARVERSVPAADALADAILADRLNGDPLPSIHGRPVRFVMPGYFAVNSVKWVRRIAFTDRESTADIQTVRYRKVPPGEEPSPNNPSLWAIGPTAVIVAAEPGAGCVTVSGVAFSGGDAIEGVDLTADGGAWEPATLSPDRGRFAWRRFHGVIQADGAAWVSARCRTGDGIQPRHSEPNQDGYAVDGWEELAYRLS